MKKLLLSLFALLLVANIYSQKKDQDYKYGWISQADRQITSFPNDSTANAIVLFEQGNSKFIAEDGRYYIVTKVYKKIKIFNKEGFEHATVKIPFYHNDRMRASVNDIKAMTYHSNQKFSLQKSKIFTTKLSEKWSEVSFTLPNIQEGSIIEYMYTIKNPFYFNFKGWRFQSSIPKLESVFKAEIPGNFVYNRVLVGGLRLSQNTSTVKRNCFKVAGVLGDADCEILTYAMTNIPAFIEEDYMTSKMNFLSRISFELSAYRGFNGTNKKYTTTWKAVDNDFKKDKDIGGQLKRKSFFKELLPEDIINEENLLSRAKKVYQYIQNHYTWNEEYKLFSNINVKKAWKNGIGTVGEINISLINALDACGIDTKLALLSTRRNGFPTKIHPVISDFNYLVARVEINNKVYLLDATEENNPFGILPYRCLNRDVRIMDFDNGSYWEAIKPYKKSYKRISMYMEINEDGDIDGRMRIGYKGYNAVYKRDHIRGVSEESYLEELEGKSDIMNYNSVKFTNLDNAEKSLTEEFELVIENDEPESSRVLLNPFFIDKISENPFKLENRTYPVDFGYPREFEFRLVLELPDNYEIESLPKGKLVKLPDNNGTFKYNVDYTNFKIRVSFKYSLNKAYFYSNEYQYLKEFYKQMILAQSEPIILKKI